MSSAERAAVPVRGRVLRWWRDPWRRPRALAAVAVLYLAWSLLPVLVAVAFSFNDGRSRSVWQGFSLRWYTTDPGSVLHDASLHAALLQTLQLGLLTTLVAVPLGTLLAFGLDRWRGRVATGTDGLLLVSFVVPETLLAVAFLLLVTHVALPVGLGTTAQVVGLVTYQLSYPAILVRTRLATIGRQYEEAAADLGAPPLAGQLRVVLPMLAPALLASCVLVFADVVDDFAIVRYLSGTSETEPVSVKIYSAARTASTPAINALATLQLVAALLVVAVGFLVYRAIGRRTGEKADLGSFSGEA